MDPFVRRKSDGGQQPAGDQVAKCKTVDEPSSGGGVSSDPSTKRIDSRSRTHGSASIGGIRGKMPFGEVFQLDVPFSLLGPLKGEISLSTLRYLAKRKKVTVLWSIDPKDFRSDREENFRENLGERSLQNGATVLLHDRVKTTGTILPKLIDSLYMDWVSFTTVGAMLG